MTVLYLTLLDMCRSEVHRRGRHPSSHRRPFPERGWVQFLLLRLLHERPMHGYQLMEEMENRGYVRSGRFETGSAYTILNRMERYGLLSSTKDEGETGRMRRIYSMTQAGKEALKRGLESVIRQKRLMDELTEYYEKNFRAEGVRSGESDNERTEER